MSRPRLPGAGPTDGRRIRPRGPGCARRRRRRGRHRRPGRASHLLRTSIASAGRVGSERLDGVGGTGGPRSAPAALAAPGRAGGSGSPWSRVESRRTRRSVTGPSRATRAVGPTLAPGHRGERSEHPERRVLLLDSVNAATIATAASLVRRSPGRVGAGDARPSARWKTRGRSPTRAAARDAQLGGTSRQASGRPASRRSPAAGPSSRCNRTRSSGPDPQYRAFGCELGGSRQASRRVSTFPGRFYLGRQALLQLHVRRTQGEEGHEDGQHHAGRQRRDVTSHGQCVPDAAHGRRKQRAPRKGQEDAGKLESDHRQHGGREWHPAGATATASTGSWWRG